MTRYQNSEASWDNDILLFIATTPIPSSCSGSPFPTAVSIQTVSTFLEKEWTATTGRCSLLYGELLNRYPAQSRYGCKIMQLCVWCFYHYFNNCLHWNLAVQSILNHASTADMQIFNKTCEFIVMVPLLFVTVYIFFCFFSRYNGYGLSIYRSCCCQTGCLSATNSKWLVYGTKKRWVFSNISQQYTYCLILQTDVIDQSFCLASTGW